MRPAGQQYAPVVRPSCTYAICGRCHRTPSSAGACSFAKSASRKSRAGKAPRGGRAQREIRLVGAILGVGVPQLYDSARQLVAQFAERSVGGIRLKHLCKMARVAACEHCGAHTRERETLAAASKPGARADVFAGYARR
eukprot:scaffold223675_cov32-Tisochrysis_lutea.AAC.2